MKTMSTFAALVIAATLGTATTAQAEPGWVDGRQANQRERIRDGIEAGDLTRKEARRLRRQQRRIARMEDRLGADGYFTPRERRRMDRVLDRASRRIARARHNDRYRGGNRGRHGRYDGRYRGRPWSNGHHRGHTTEIHHHYEPAPAEIVETSPSINRSFEVDLNGVRVVWSASALQ
jgi:hypothetical protein